MPCTSGGGRACAVALRAGWAGLTAARPTPLVAGRDAARAGRQRHWCCSTACRWSIRYSASGFYGSDNAQQVNATISPDVGAGLGSPAVARAAMASGRRRKTSAVRPDAQGRYKTWAVTLRGVAPVGGVGEIQARSPARLLTPIATTGRRVSARALYGVLRMRSRCAWPAKPASACRRSISYIAVFRFSGGDGCQYRAGARADEGRRGRS